LRVGGKKKIIIHTYQTVDDDVANPTTFDTISRMSGEDAGGVNNFIKGNIFKLCYNTFS